MDDALAILRAICAALPDAVETLTFGHPTFKAGGKSFAVLDSYKGVDCLWLRIDPGRRDELLKQAGWFKSPYDPREEALCWDLRHVDWDKAEVLIHSSHQMAKHRVGSEAPPYL
jgi:predicted DNA-binding protein (MmcQ/YjbR family)